MSRLARRKSTHINAPHQAYEVITCRYTRRAASDSHFVYTGPVLQAASQKVRFTPLLSILLIFLAWTPVHAEGEGLAGASTVKTSSMLVSLPDIGPKESTPGATGPGVYQSELAESEGSAAVLDFSYYLALALGVLGLLYIRRQTQAL